MEESAQGFHSGSVSCPTPMLQLSRYSISKGFLSNFGLVTTLRISHVVKYRPIDLAEYHVRKSTLNHRHLIIDQRLFEQSDILQAWWCEFKTAIPRNQCYRSIRLLAGDRTVLNNICIALIGLNVLVVCVVGVLSLAMTLFREGYL